MHALRIRPALRFTGAHIGVEQLIAIKGDDADLQDFCAVVQAGGFGVQDEGVVLSEVLDERFHVHVTNFLPV